MTLHAYTIESGICAPRLRVDTYSSLTVRTTQLSRNNSAMNTGAAKLEMHLVQNTSLQIVNK